MAEVIVKKEKIDTNEKMMRDGCMVNTEGRRGQQVGLVVEMDFVF